MSKAAKTTKKTERPMTVAEKIVAQQRALEAGKAGYKRSDELMDELTPLMRDGKPWVLADGSTAHLVDKFAEKDSIGAGLKVRRYEIEIERASDITKKL